MKISTQPRVIAVVASLLAGGTLGCTSWFDPSTDDVVDPSQLNSAAAIQTLLNGARRDFAIAFVGAGDDSVEGIALVAGLVADEYDNSDTFPTRQEMDQRDMNIHNVSLLDVYRDLHRARASADGTAAKARALTPNDADTIAELYLLSGTIVLSFAEDYCSGVPLSHVVGTTLVYGTQMTTTELYEAATAKFDSALAVGPSAALAGAATLGKARALLGLGQVAQAGALAASVPTDLLYTTHHSEVTPAVENGIWAFVDFTSRWSVSPGTGDAMIDFADANDPRVPVEFVGVGFDGSTPQYNELLFPSPSSPVPVYSGIEARLIEAEAALAANNPGTALVMLNNLRSAAGLGPLSDPGTTASRQDQLFRERAFWLFSTDRRLGDLRRLIRQYGRDPDQAFPHGAYYKGGDYGTDVNIPISFEEGNNPNIGLQGQSCLDRNP